MDSWIFYRESDKEEEEEEEEEVGQKRLAFYGSEQRDFV